MAQGLLSSTSFSPILPPAVKRETTHFPSFREVVPYCPLSCSLEQAVSLPLSRVPVTSEQVAQQQIEDDERLARSLHHQESAHDDHISDQFPSDYVVPEKYLGKLVDTIVAIKKESGKKRFSSYAFLKDEVGMSEVKPDAVAVIAVEDFNICKKYLDDLKTKGLNKDLYQKTSVALGNMKVTVSRKKRSSQKIGGMDEEQAEAKRAKRRIKNMPKGKIEAKNARRRVENMSEEKIEAKRANQRVEGMDEEKAEKLRAK